MSSHRETKFVGLIDQLGTNLTFQQQILGTANEVSGYSMDYIQEQFEKEYGKPLTDEQTEELHKRIRELGFV